MTIGSCTAGQQAEDGDDVEGSTAGAAGDTDDEGLTADGATAEAAANAGKAGPDEAAANACKAGPEVQDC